MQSYIVCDDKENCDIKFFNNHTLTETLDLLYDNKPTSIIKFNKIVTVEDHFHDGGFGSWVGEVLNTYKNNINFNYKYVSVDTINDVGSKKYLLQKYGPKSK